MIQCECNDEIMRSIIHWCLINNIINHEYEYCHAGIISAYEGNDLTGKHEHNEHRHYSKSLIITIICIPGILFTIGFMAINMTDDTSMSSLQRMIMNQRRKTILIPICYHCKHETNQYRTIQHHVPSTLIHG